MLIKYRQTLLIIFIQLALASALVLYSRSVVVAVLSLVVFIAAVAQSVTLIRSTDGVRRNLLYSVFLSDHQVPVVVGLIVLAISPVVVCVVTGEQLGQVLPGSDHNSLINLVANIAEALVILSSMNILARSSEIQESQIENTPFGQLALIVMLDVSLLMTAAFIPTQQYEPFNQAFQLHWLSEVLNSIWLFCSVFYLFSVLGQITISYLLIKPNASWQLFRIRDLLLFESCFVYCFSLGILSEPGGMGFSAFLSMSPIFIILSMFFIEILGIQIKTPVLQKTSALMRTVFGTVHFFVYCLIIARRMELPYLFFIPLTVGTPLLMILLMPLSRWLVARRKLVREMESINQKKLTVSQTGSLDAQPEANSATWFDDKVRVYHEYRELKL
jgi:hypothetical protein